MKETYYKLLDFIIGNDNNIFIGKTLILESGDGLLFIDYRPRNQNDNIEHILIYSQTYSVVNSYMPLLREQHMKYIADWMVDRFGVEIENGIVCLYSKDNVYKKPYNDLQGLIDKKK